MNKKRQTNGKTPKKDYKKIKKVKDKRNLKICVERNSYCKFCGSKVEVSAHHIRFRSEGGDDSMGNLISLCFPCHRKIHDGYQMGYDYFPGKVLMIGILEKINLRKYDKVLEFLKSKRNTK